MTNKKTPHAKAEELADQELDQAQGGAITRTSTTDSTATLDADTQPKLSAFAKLRNSIYDTIP